MQAMIFCAGLGTRLKPITDTLPKALLPLGGKTLLEYQIDKLKKAGISDIIVNVHHLAKQITDFLAKNNNFGVNIRVSDESDMLLNTGGGLRKALEMSGTDEPLLALNVDILSNIDTRMFINAFDENTDALLVVSERQTQRYLCFDNGRLCGWTNIATGEQKGFDGRRLAFSGMQILNDDTLPRLQQIDETKFSLIPFYLEIMKEVPLQAYVPSGYRMMDVGKIDQITEAELFAESLK